MAAPESPQEPSWSPEIQGSYNEETRFYLIVSGACEVWAGVNEFILSQSQEAEAFALFGAFALGIAGFSWIEGKANRHCMATWINRRRLPRESRHKGMQLSDPNDPIPDEFGNYLSDT